VKTEVGYIDILINNAGIVSGRKVLDCTDAAMKKTMDVNAAAHFWVRCLVIMAFRMQQSMQFDMLMQML